MKTRLSVVIAAIVISGLLVGFAGTALQSKNPLDLQPIQVTEGVLPWFREFGNAAKELRLSSKYPQLGFSECREVIEINQTVLCLFNAQEEMGYTFARASCYIEGSFCGYDKGHLLSLNDHNFNLAVMQIGGIDLRGRDLIRFYQALLNKCQSSTTPAEDCPNVYEKNAFENFILPYAKSHPDLVLIGVSKFGTQAWNETLVHEILHAQYFNDVEFREAVDGFWNQLPKKEKVQIRKILGRQYDSTDEILMKNEFQAYLLQPNAQNPKALLSKLVPKYRDRLLTHLAAIGASPVQISLSAKPPR